MQNKKDNKCETQKAVIRITLTIDAWRRIFRYEDVDELFDCAETDSKLKEALVKILYDTFVCGAYPEEVTPDANISDMVFWFEEQNQNGEFWTLIFSLAVNVPTDKKED